MSVRASAAYDLVLNNKSSAGRNAFLNSLDTVDNKVAALAVGGFAALGVAGAASFTALYNAQAPLIDQLGKTSETLQINVVSLQAMEDAAARAGIGTDQLAGSLTEGLKRISEASVGAGGAGEILDKIGLSAQELQKIAPEERIYEVLRALDGIEDAGNRIEYADKIFGGAGIDLIRLSVDAISDAEQEMRDLGIALQEVDVENVERLNDEIQRVQRNTSQASKVFVGAMAPAIIAVMETMFNLGDASINVRESFVGMADGVVTVVGFVGDRVNDIRRFIKGLEFTFQNMGTNIYRLLDKLPGLDFGDQIKEEFDKGIEIYGEYLAIDENGKFSERLKANLKAVREEAEGAARAIRDAQGGVNFPNTDLPGGSASGTSSKPRGPESGGDQIEAQIARAIELEEAEVKRQDDSALARIQREIGYAQDLGLTKEELLFQEIARTADLLDDVALRDVSRTEEVNTLKTAANQQYHDQYLDMVKVKADEEDKRLEESMKLGRDYIEQGLEHFASKNEVADGLHKALVARRLFRQGREAVMGAFAWGNFHGGPPLGYLAAATAAGFTAALIAEAVGGGGGSSVTTGGSSLAAVSDTSSDSSSATATSTTVAQSAPAQIIQYNAYFPTAVAEGDRESVARQQIDDDIKAKRIVVGDDIEVRINVFDYESYGT